MRFWSVARSMVRTLRLALDVLFLAGAVCRFALTFDEPGRHEQEPVSSIA
jgi:hypothetical protein